jgi:hypothetical protein
MGLRVTSEGREEDALRAQLIKKGQKEGVAVDRGQP